MEEHIQQHQHIGPADRQLLAIEGLIDTVTSVPTHTPTKFEQQIKLYVNSLTSPTTKHLYIYSHKAHAWYNADLNAPITTYTTTVANAAINNAPHDVVSFTMPANTMADGDVIKIIFPATFQYNGGAPTTLEVKFHYGSVSTHLFNGTVNPSVSTFDMFYEVMVQRNGSNLYVLTGTIDAQSNFANTPAASNANTLGSATFSSDQTVKISVDFNTTDTGSGFTTGKARTIKINAP